MVSVRKPAPPGRLSEPNSRIVICRGSSGMVSTGKSGTDNSGWAVDVGNGVRVGRAVGVTTAVGGKGWKGVGVAVEFATISGKNGSGVPPLICDWSGISVTDAGRIAKAGMLQDTMNMLRIKNWMRRFVSVICDH